MILLQWLLQRKHLDPARWLVEEKADSIERIIRVKRGVRAEAIDIFIDW